MNKTIINFLVLIILVIHKVNAQNIVEVLPGIGTLENAISKCNAGDILQLNGGSEYLLSTSVSTFGIIDKPLTIQVKNGSTEKAIIKLAPNASTTKKYYFFTIKDGGALTLSGLDIHGIAKDTAVASSMIIFDARPAPQNARFGNFRFEDCIFHDFKDYIVHGMKDDYARGSIQDTVFINKLIVYNANHFLQYKHVSLRHIEMKNSTIYKLNGMALKIGKIGYRCQLLNPTKPYIPLTDSTITPTGFIDHCTMDDLGDIHGHVQVDDAFHTLTVSNCIISNQQQYNQPALYFLEPKIKTAVLIQNTCFWRCAPPNEMVGGKQWIGYQFEDSMNIEPKYANASAGNFTLPENSLLLTVGKDGGPIGDMRWVKNFTSVYNLQSESFSKSTSYPNPFQTSTNIAFTVPVEAFVTLSVYNVSGIEVASLLNENIQQGKYVINWNAVNFESGIYFYHLKIGSQVETKKMILQKQK